MVQRWLVPGMTAFGAGLQRLAVPVSVAFPRLGEPQHPQPWVVTMLWRLEQRRDMITVTVYKSFRLERERVYKSWFQI